MSKFGGKMKVNSVFVFLILFSAYLFCSDIPDRIGELELLVNSSEIFLNDSEKSNLLQIVKLLKKDLRNRVSSSDENENDFSSLNNRLNILVNFLGGYILVFSDGTEEVVEKEALEKSETLKNLIEGISAQEVGSIDLQRIDKETGDRIVQLLEIIVANPDSLLAKLDSYNLQIPALLNLIKAAHYLDIRVLEDALIQFCNSKYATDEDFNNFLLQSLKVDVLEDFLVSMIKAKRASFELLNSARKYLNISISGDGNTIVAIGSDNRIYIFDRAGNEIGSNIAMGYLSVSISADGNTIAAIGSDDLIYILNIDGTQIGFISVVSNIEWYLSVSISAAGNTIVAIGSDNRIYIFDRAGNEIGSNIAMGYLSVSISGDGNTIAAIGPYGNIYIFDRTGAQIGVVSVLSNIGWYSSVSISGDGNTIVAMGSDGRIYIFDRTGNQIGSNTSRPYKSVSISANGSRIVVIGVDGGIYIFDRTGTQIASNTERKYYNVSISADGNTIVAVAEDNHIYRLNSIGYLEKLFEKAEFKEVETELKSLIDQLKLN
jgi:hypothetical protein